ATWVVSLMGYSLAACDRNFDHRSFVPFRARQRFKVQMANRGFQRSFWLYAVILLSTACSSVDLETGFVRDRRIESEIISQTTDTYPEIDPLYISAEITEMLDRLIAKNDSLTLRIAKIQTLLFDEGYLNLQYSESQTLTADEVFRSRRGNCLSAMNLYIAMARYAGIDAAFQTVAVRPEWDKRGELLILSRHINASGSLGYKRKYIVDFTPEIQLQQLTAKTVSDLHARALFFNNLGVEALVSEDLEAALKYFKNALFLKPDLAIAWNNTGAAFNRVGDSELAEYSYHMALWHENDNATAVNNLAKHYRNAGALVTAEQYEQAIQQFNERNPYYHFSRGLVALETKDLMLARESFLNALRLKGTEPDFYNALAKVYAEMGEELKAAEMRQRAEAVLVSDVAIYRSSSDKLRLIDSSGIIGKGRAGSTIKLDQFNNQPW
ncbi:MAG: tetratricopeptide repeat protein, partial [Pseudomonadota bacterium]|nr:tetratricopeptide repeat protein [Pseudomonadota bacterium]